MGQELSEQRSAGYGKDVRGVIRALWSGAMDYDQGFMIMWSTVEISLTRAYYEGMRACGIEPAEMSPEERMELAQAVALERGFIDGLVSACLANSRAEGKKLAPLLSRARLWEQRYNDLVNRAKQKACKDKKLRWVRTAQESCPSCVKLDGKVKRASYWERMDVRPQHPSKLLCMRGAKGPSVCKCGFEETDDPCTPGPLPDLP